MNKKNIVNYTGVLGLYIFSVSLMVSKAGMNIGLGLMFLAVLFIDKQEEKIKLEEEQKYLFILIILVPVFSLFSAGGINSFFICLEKTYRYIPIFLIPIFLKKSIKYRSLIYCIYISIIVNFINGLKFYQTKNWNFNLRYQSYGVSLLDDAHMFSMLSFIVLAIIIYSFNDKKYINFFISIVVYLIILLALIFSQTRGAWLSFLGGLIFFYYFSAKNKKIAIITIISVFLLIYNLKNIDIIEKNRYIKRWLSITDIQNDSPKIRILMWEGAVYSFKNNVIFGTGRDNSPKYILEYLEKENKYSEVKNKSSLKVIAQTGNTHNMYFSSLAEEGVLFFYLLWIWSFILIKEIKFQKELKVQSLEYYIMNACIGLTVAFYITGLTENAWKNVWKTNVYLLGIAIYLTLKKVKRENNDKEKNIILY